MRRKRTIPPDHPAFAGLPVKMITLGDGGEQAAVHVAGRLSSQIMPLICLAGFQRNMSDFTELRSYFQRLVGGDWPIVLIDFQGRGRSSDRREAGQYGSPRDAQDVATIAAALGIERAAFLGQGFGGQVIMTLAAYRPHLLGSAILLDAGPVTDPRGIVRLRNNIGHLESLRGTQAIAHGFHRILQGDYPGASEEQIGRLMGRTHFVDKRGRPRPLYDHRLTDALDAFTHDDILVAQWPLFEALANVPLLLIRTQLTDQVQRETFEKMVKLRPDAIARTILGQGSPALFDHLEDVQTIAQFVQQYGQL